MMKTLLSILLFWFFNIANSQNLKDVLLNKTYEIDFVGIDFSKAKLVGTSSQFKNPKKIITDYFPRWNNIFHIDSDKYKLTYYFHKKNINLITETVDSINNIVDETKLVTNITPKKLKDEDIQNIINKYSIDSKNKVSFVLIVNSFNKLRRLAVIDIVYFNNKTRKVIFKQTITSEPGGFGLKNYWEGALLNMFKQVEKKEYKKWRKKYKNFTK